MERECFRRLLLSGASNRVDARRVVHEIVHNVEKLSGTVEFFFSWIHEHPGHAASLLSNYLPSGYTYSIVDKSACSEIFRELMAPRLAQPSAAISNMLLPSGLSPLTRKRDLILQSSERRLARLPTLVVGDSFKVLKQCIEYRSRQGKSPFPFETTSAHLRLLGYDTQWRQLRDGIHRNDAFFMEFCTMTNTILSTVYQKRQIHRLTIKLQQVEDILKEMELKITNTLPASEITDVSNNEGSDLEEKSCEEEESMSSSPEPDAGTARRSRRLLANRNDHDAVPPSEQSILYNSDSDHEPGGEVSINSDEESSEDESSEEESIPGNPSHAAGTVRRSGRLAAKPPTNSGNVRRSAVGKERSGTTSKSLATKKATPRSPPVATFSFPSNFRLQCAHVAGKLVVGRLKETGKLLDFILPSGREIHRRFGGTGKHCSEDGEIEIELVELRAPRMAGDCPFVVVFRRGWSSWMRDLIMAEANREPHIHDTKSNGGKSVLSCSFASEPGDDRLPFMKLGHLHGIQSIPATTLKRLMLKAQSELANLFIDETNLLLQQASAYSQNQNHVFDEAVDTVATKFLQQHAGPTNCIDPVLLQSVPRQVNNTCIEKNGKFGKHSDACTTICRKECGPTPAPVCSANGDKLPTRQDLVVCTNVFGKGEGSTQGVAWFHKDKKLGSIYTLDRCCHLQFIGCNALDIEHAVDNCNLPAGIRKKMKSVAPSVRMTSTARMVYHPTRDKAAYEAALREDKLSSEFLNIKELSLYNISNAIGDGEPVVDESAVPQPVHRGTGSAPPPPWQPNKKMIGFQWPTTPQPLRDNLTREEFVEHFGKGKHPLHQMAELARPKKQPKQQLVMNYRLNTCAFDHGYLIYNEDTRMQPLWTVDQQLCCPGSELPPARIPNQVSKQSSEILNHLAKNFLLLYEQYKNEPESTLAHYKWAIRCLRECDRNGGIAEEMEQSLWDEFRSLPPLIICGCGGSTQPSGSFAPTAKTAGPSDCHVILGHHQDLTAGANKTLLECFYMQNALHVAMDANTWDLVLGDAGKTKNKKKETTRYVSIGYFRIKRFHPRKLSKEEVGERFRSMPGYLDNEQNVYNVNFLMQGYYEFELEHAFSFRQYMDMFRRSSGQKFTYQHLRVAPCDRSGLVVPIDELRKEKFTGHYIHDHIIDWYVDPQHKEEFLKSIPSSKDHARSQWYHVTMEEFFAVLLSVSGACAMRSDLAQCTKALRRGNKNETVVVPLHGKMSSKMSMPTRMTPTPHPNADLDLNVVFVGHCMQELLQQQQKKKQKPVLKKLEANSYCSYSKPDLSNKANVTYLCDCLFMATVMRLTGSIGALEGFSKFMAQHYPRERLRCLNLPTVELGRHFAEFLQASKIEMSGFLSDQHRKSLPTFVSSKADFVSFLYNCCNHELGFVRVKKYLVQCSEAGRDVRRKDLIERIKAILCSCGGVELSPDLDFLVPKIISDVESVVPEFAGEVEFDSVGMGKGCKDGLALIQLPPEMEQLSEREKFKYVHKCKLEFLLGLNEKGRNARGWKGVRRGGQLTVVSIRTGRPYSYQDTEHALCKLWLTARAAHPSRNVAKGVNQLTRAHCFPVPKGTLWAEKCIKVMSFVMGAYKTAKDDSEKVCELPPHYDFTRYRQT